MDSVEMQEMQRQSFFKNLAHTPLEQVTGEVDAVNFLSPAEREGLKRRASALMAERSQRVGEWLTNEYESFHQRAERVEEEAEAVATDVDTLMAEVKTGAVPLDEFRRRFEQLERRAVNAQRNTDSFARLPERFQRMEDTPDEVVRDLERRYPLLRQSVLGSGIPSVGPQ